MDVRDEGPGHDGGAPASRTQAWGCSRLKEALGDACAPCPERTGALRRELLCRCPVALSLRLLERVERDGADPAQLTPAQRASLAFQERALARRLPDFAAEAVERAAQHAGRLRDDHGACDVVGCLSCRAASVVEALAARTADLAPAST